MVLDALGNSLRDTLKRIANAPHIDKKLIREVMMDIQRALLRGDVNVKLVLELTKEIERRALTEKPLSGMSNREHVIRIVYDELVKILGRSKTIPLRKQAIMMVGLYGMGKTTSCAKLAKYFQKKGMRVGLIASDVHRPAAYEQLCQLGAGINVPVHGDGKDAVKLVKSGLKEFKNMDVVIIDTSGRHSLETELITEMCDIAKVSKATEKFLVLDSTIGQQAKAQAKAFNDAIGITGVVLTKMDGSAKGGGALSAISETKAPIAFIGTGEKIVDLEHFEPTRFVSRLLGMGDIQTLLEKAQEAVEMETAEKLSKKFMSGKFTLKDMYEQMDMISGMGPLQKLMDLLPFGMKAKLPEGTMDDAQARLGKFKVIMDSMTDKELEEPGIVRSSRIKRIAYGAGVEPKNVKELLKYYNMTKRMMKGFGGRQIPRKLMRSLKFQDMGM